MMTPERWAHVSALFNDASRLPREAQLTWLATTCPEDVRADVHALLAAYHADPSFLEQPVDPRPALDAVTTSGLAGQRVGAYRLVREVGRGGTSVVFEAHRDDQEFDRRVAIKILPGWTAAIMADRFRFERAVLAGLDHPGIARLLDAGTTGMGVSYCVMEFVDGQPIDEWCRAAQLPIAARVRLVERVCDAVAYAHRHLVVHRDLKPGNILVTPEGEPKLLDFGIATLLEAEEGFSAGTTRTGFASFTPDYASPEQFRGEKVTVATDVYSLGVLLYLLLADRRPYDLAGRSPLDAMRIVCEQEPPRPSTVAPSERRTDLHGDLDTIVEKALRKDPSQRYGTIGDLAADLRAWREHRPIAAVPATPLYRASRFVRRHRLAVALGAALLVAVAGGGAAALWQGRIAERERARADARFADVRRLAGAVVGPLYDAIARVPGSTEAKQVLVREALAYLNTLSAQAAGDLDLKAELADAYEKIGDVQGSPFGPNLGDRAGARESYETLHALRAEVLQARPADVAARRGMAEADRRLGDLAFGENQLKEAVAAYELALSRLPDGPASPDLALTRARLHDRIGVTLARTGQPADAMRHFDQAIAIARPLADASGASPATRRFLMASLGNSGDVPFYQGKFAEALPRYEGALAIARAAAVSPLDQAAARRDLQLTATRTAYALKELGRLDEGAALEREAIQILTELIALDPRALSRRFELAQAQRGLALTHLQRRDHDEAHAAITAALDTFRAAFAQGAAPDQLFAYAAAWGTLGEVERARGRWPESIDALRRAQKEFADPAIDARKGSERFRLQAILGDALAHQGRRTGSAPLIAEARQAYDAAHAGLTTLAAAGRLESRLAGLPADIHGKLQALR